MANFIMGIISLAVGVVVLAGVFMNQVHGIFSNPNISNCVGGTGNATTGCSGGYSMTSAEVALWGLLGVCAIAGIVYGVMNVMGIV